MEALQAILAEHGIDTSTLRRLDRAPDEIYLITVPGADAVPLWRRLRALVETTGCWPLILGSREDVEMHLESLEDMGSGSAEILERAAALDPEKWLAKQFAEIDAEADAADAEAWDEEMAEYLEEMGDSAPALDGEEESDDFTIPREILTGKPLPEVHLALLPTEHGWESAAYLRFGGWNACPDPEIHVALWRRWHQLYGAEPVGNTHDVIEAHVERPPTDEDAAMVLAREQYWYCGDIVDQGCGSLTRLATILQNRATWYFWWD